MNNLIRNLHIRNFRSLASASIASCGPLNVLIGKNNAGKSSALVAIPLIFEHLATGQIVCPWKTERHAEQFTHRDTTKALQLGAELTLDESNRKILLDGLRETAPHLGKSIEQLADESSISFICRFVYDNKVPYQYLEYVSVGHIDSSDERLKPGSTPLLSTSPESARQLFKKFQDGDELRQKVAAIKRLVESDGFPLSSFFDNKRSYPPQYLIDRVLQTESPTAAPLRRELIALLEGSDSQETLKAKASSQVAAANDEIERISNIEIETPLSTYTGEVRVEPAYVTEMCRAFGATPILRLGERKIPIGKKEAARLLQLKVRRGGPERLQVVQQTVQALLGVSLDAFQGEGGRDNAEIDVDNFLAEANGAGIRESLRLILDLELEPCEVVLVEEPEVHLHPGLEFAVHSYLQEKSRTKQFFLSTHSTNFIDTASPQYIYLIARGATGVASCERLAEEDAPVKLPAELGIRLSTVFMFDKIVFVEGPSDESVLRELARTLGTDLGSAGVAFIHMGGVANFTHYAAQATLDLLSRRRVRMWFIVDRDERDEAEVRRMIERLGDRATLFVLERRELENFLVNETAIQALVRQKTRQEPSSDRYAAALAAAVEATSASVVQLLLEKNSLTPLYLRGRDKTGTTLDRLENAKAEIEGRIGRMSGEQARIEQEVTKNWNLEKALSLVPGSHLLDAICRRLGSTFDKQGGDSLKLARHVPSSAIPSQIRSMLEQITGTPR